MLLPRNNKLLGSFLIQHLLSVSGYIDTGVTAEWETLFVPRCESVSPRYFSQHMNRLPCTAAGKCHYEMISQLNGEKKLFSFQCIFLIQAGKLADQIVALYSLFAAQPA